MIPAPAPAAGGRRVIPRPERPGAGRRVAWALLVLGGAGVAWWLLRPVTGPTLVTAVARRQEVRGAWPLPEFKPFYAAAYRDSGAPAREVGWLRGAGLNSWFPLAYAQGRVAWPSEVLPDTRALWGEWSPLDAALAEARRLDVDVYLYFVVGYAGRPDDPWTAPRLRDRPERDMVNRLGAGTLAGAAGGAVTGSAALWQTFCLSETADFLVRVVEEALGRYPGVQGIHLDYLRLPGEDFDYAEACLDRFLDERGYQVPGDTVAVRAAAVLTRHGPEWQAFRAGQVTGLLRRVREFLDRRHPGLALTVTVEADPDAAYRVFGQDWRGWVREGLVDAIVPVAAAGWAPEELRAYTEALVDWAGQVAAEHRSRRRTVRTAAVIVGLETAPEAPLEPDRLEALVDAVRAAGAQGIVLRPLPAWRREQYQVLRRLGAPASDTWPELRDYEPVLRRLFPGGG